MDSTVIIRIPQPTSTNTKTGIVYQVGKIQSRRPGSRKTYWTDWPPAPHQESTQLTTWWALVTSTRLVKEPSVTPKDIPEAHSRATKQHTSTTNIPRTGLSRNAQHAEAILARCTRIQNLTRWLGYLLKMRWAQAMQSPLISSSSRQLWIRLGRDRLTAWWGSLQ